MPKLRAVCCTSLTIWMIPAGWADVAHLGRCKQAWFKTFLKLEHEIASDQTFGRVFAMLDPDQLERYFMN